MFCCFSQPRFSNPSSIVELHVHMGCEKCVRRIRKAISKLHGVDRLYIEMKKEKMTVTGYVDPGHVLLAVRETGRKADFWQHGEQYHSSAAAQDGDHGSNFTTSYIDNYHKHGFNEHMQQHGYYPNTNHNHAYDHATTLCSDEHVHACTIM